MKNDKEHIDIIIECLEKGYGRVESCKAAGISYKTFTRWMKKSQFCQIIKKSESIGRDVNKEQCKRRILTDASWQSAAWWLERNYPDEFRNRADMTVNVSKLDDFFPPDKDLEDAAKD
jgi:hypothetical protein